MSDTELYATLRRCEAEFRVNPTPARHAAIVAGAVQLLSAGVDSPNLRILAGEDRADSQELTKYLEATLADLGLSPLGHGDALLLIMEATAADLLAGRLGATEAARLLWGTWYPSGDELGIGPAAASLAYEAAAFDHFGLEPEEASVEDLVNEARAFINRPRAGDIPER